MNNTRRLATLDDLLKGVPTFTCKEGCSDCCGIVPMTRLEWKRIQERTGITKQYDENGNCNLLKDGKCSVYDIRPAICRIFGASTEPRLQCPHGCKSERLLTAKETDGLIMQVDRLGHGLILDDAPFDKVSKAFK
jgi:Fe-S-cluster containining protein